MRYFIVILTMLCLTGCLPGGNGFEGNDNVNKNPTPTPTPSPEVKPASLEYVSGAGQTAKVNELYGTPIVFKIIGDDNQPLAGATFFILDQESSVSDSNGLASLTLRAATMTGFPIEYPVDLYNEDDTAPIDTKVVELTTTAGAPKALELAQDIIDGDTITLGDPYNFVFIATDQYGNHADPDEVENSIEIDIFSDASCTTPSTIAFADALLDPQVIDGGLEVYTNFVFAPDSDGSLHIRVKITGETASICTSELNVTP